jgi:endonuclease YncB( thermonuclease family)
MPWRWLLLLALLAALPSAGYAQQTIVGAASVIDGDTIEIHGQRVRLYGIDAPESRQECSLADRAPWRCGQQAAFALADRIGRATLRCEPRDRDRYGRVVAVCYNGREDVGRWMVANGWAVAFRRYSLDYVADEDRARRNRLGLWSGTFEMPWDWRASGGAH